jgi:hypothetical protein
MLTIQVPQEFDKACKTALEDFSKTPSTLTVKEVQSRLTNFDLDNTTASALLKAWKKENKGRAGGKIAEWKQDSELLHQAIEHMDDAVLGRDPSAEIDWRVLCLDVYAIAKGQQPGSLADEEL